MNTQIIAYSNPELKPVGRSRQSGKERSPQQLSLFPLANERQKSHKRQSPHQLRSKQLKLWGLSQAKEEVSPYLQIASVPINERIDPKEVRYILVISPHGIRAAGGQYTAEEAHAIGGATKNWDWSLDENQRPFCLPALEALLDSICKCSCFKGGEG